MERVGLMERAGLTVPVLDWSSSVKEMLERSRHDDQSTRARFSAISGPGFSVETES